MIAKAKLFFFRYHDNTSSIRIYVVPLYILNSVKNCHKFLNCTQIHYHICVILVKISYIRSLRCFILDSNMHLLSICTTYQLCKFLLRNYISTHYDLCTLKRASKTKSTSNCVRFYKIWYSKYPYKLLFQAKQKICRL